MEAHAARAAADVEDAAPDEPHRATMVRGPAPERREVEAWAHHARGDVPVVTLDDLRGLPALQVGEKHLAEGVAGHRGFQPSTSRTSRWSTVKSMRNATARSTVAARAVR